MYVFPVPERIHCLRSGFSRKADSARFIDLVTPGTPEFNFDPNPRSSIECPFLLIASPYQYSI
jgi:hypothetical protein